MMTIATLSLLVGIAGSTKKVENDVVAEAIDVHTLEPDRYKKGTAILHESCSDGNLAIVVISM